jgi:hypothetical protein
MHQGADGEISHKPVMDEMQYVVQAYKYVKARAEWADASVLCAGMHTPFLHTCASLAEGHFP